MPHQPQSTAHCTTQKVLLFH